MEMFTPSKLEDVCAGAEKIELAKLSVDHATRKGAYIRCWTGLVCRTFFVGIGRPTIND